MIAGAHRTRVTARPRAASASRPARRPHSGRYRDSNAVGVSIRLVARASEHSSHDGADGRKMRGRSQPTSTSAFGAGRRESHDSSDFYRRFEAPEVTSDSHVEALPDLPQGGSACIETDSAEMVLPGGGPLPGGSVALVVTSPPYFVGKEYEQALGEGSIPKTYLDYLDMLTEVFAECKRVLEPGGRIAVNVANLGRKPYRSLSADVIAILQDRLHMLLRGEVIWRKAEGASGSCAWGSYRSATNPVLRDVTERVVIASKGRFDRALPAAARLSLGLPHESDLAADEFMAATLDVWDIQPESAKRVNHPAPFPVELPQRLIGLYTYKHDLVVDPFMGSGSTLVAAARSGRRYLGYDTDPGYVAIARERVEKEISAGAEGRQVAGPVQSKAAGTIAQELIQEAGFRIVDKKARQPRLGLDVDFVALDGAGCSWYFAVSGAFTTTRGGLVRADTLWKSLGQAFVLGARGRRPLVLLTTDLPKPRSEGDTALRALGPGAVFDVMQMLSDADRSRLTLYGRGGLSTKPLSGFWTDADIAKLGWGSVATESSPSAKSSATELKAGRSTPRT